MKHVLVILLLFFMNNPSWGQSLESKIHDMIEFIESYTELEYDGSELPSIHIVSEKQVCQNVYVPPRDVCDVAGYYDHANNNIFITDKPTKFMVDDRYHEVVLVHELVHFLQYTNGIYETIECKQALERDGFMIQDRYVEENNIDPQNAPDALFALVASMCPSMNPMLFGEH